METIARNKYVGSLLSLRQNGMIKIITGIRRCGKSFLLFNLYSDKLESMGISPERIIKIDLESYSNRRLRDPEVLYDHVESRITDSQTYFLLIDEVQMLGDFEAVLNGFLHKGNLDVYVTGSNAKFLSKDVITEFRGRGFEVRMLPLSFGEYMSAYKGTVQSGLNEYLLYGGLPQILSYDSDENKAAFLRSLFAETYLRDIKERYGIKNDSDLEDLIDLLSSDIGTLTNPNKIANTFRSVKRSGMSYDTVKDYIDHLIDAFVIEKATRYDIKGKRYIDTPYKYYFSDLGLRNARLNFRQYEKTHLMENAVYNELVYRGFNVDVGVLPTVKRNAEGRQYRSQLEVDFVCNAGSRRYYVQSAYRMDTGEKERQETASLMGIDDSFKKVVIVGEEIPVCHNEAGITIMSIYDFLMKENSLEL